MNEIAELFKNLLKFGECYGLDFFLFKYYPYDVALINTVKEIFF